MTSAPRDSPSPAVSPSVAPSPRGGRWRRGVLVLLLAALLGWAVNQRMVANMGRGLPVLPDLKGQPPSMVAQLQQADRRARAHPLDAEAVGGLGMVYHANLFLDHAVACYGLAGERAASDWRWAYLRTIAGAERAEAETLIEGYVRVTTLNPDLGMAWYRMAEAELKRGGYERAEAGYRRAQAAFARQPDDRFVKQSAFPLVLYARLGEAQALLRQGKVEAALALAQAIAAERPSFGGALALVEQAHRVLGQFDEAERAHKLSSAAVEFHQPLDPYESELWRLSANPTVLLYAADQATRQGDRQGAVAYLERAVEVNPGDLPTLLIAGRQLHGQQEFERALELFERAVRLNPDSLEAQSGRVKAMVSVGQAVAAQAIADALVARHPHESDAHVAQGVVLADLGDFAGAEAALRRALRMGVVNPGDLWPILGGTLARARQWEAAIEAYKQGLAARQNNATLRIEMATAYMALGRKNEAIEELRTAMLYMPDDSRLRHDLAEALGSTGQFVEAEEVARRVVLREPWSPRAQLWYATIAARAGRVADAIHHCQTALDLAPNRREAYELMEQLRRLPPEPADATRRASTAPAGLVASAERGRALYLNWCAPCHSTDGSAGIAPTLRGLIGRARVFADGRQLVADAAYVRDSILEPQARLVKGFPPLMPRVRLRDYEINSLVQFMEGLK